MRGVRLILSMADEEKNSELLYALRRRAVGDPNKTRFPVFFQR